MANVIPNVGEVVFEFNKSNTTLTCEIKTKFGVSAYGAFSSNRMGRDINTGRASVSALIEALENLKDHLDFHQKVEDWFDEFDEFDELDDLDGEDDYDFWEDGEEDATAVELLKAIVTANRANRAKSSIRNLSKFN